MKPAKSPAVRYSGHWEETYAAENAGALGRWQGKRSATEAERLRAKQIVAFNNAKNRAVKLINKRKGAMDDPAIHAAIDKLDLLMLAVRSHDKRRPKPEDRERIPWDPGTLSAMSDVREELIRALFQRKIEDRDAGAAQLHAMLTGKSFLDRKGSK